MGYLCMQVQCICMYIHVQSFHIHKTSYTIHVYTYMYVRTYIHTCTCTCMLDGTCMYSTMYIYRISDEMYQCMYIDSLSFLHPSPWLQQSPPPSVRWEKPPLLSPPPSVPWWRQSPMWRERKRWRTCKTLFMIYSVWPGSCRGAITMWLRYM